MGEDKREELHLEIYENRYELYQNGQIRIYHQGYQNEEAQSRYSTINRALNDGYLDKMIAKLREIEYTELSEKDKNLINKLVDGITSEVGRAIVGVVFLQMTIKSICHDQSIRLHKGTNRRGSFSWKDGISMRTLDANYTTPFLRENGLLNLNKYGVFMTRSLAENYPYSKLYKAEMRGPFDQWIEVVDALEDGTMPADIGLYYLTAQLKNRTDEFKKMAEEAVDLAKKYKDLSFFSVKEFMVGFVNDTKYSARAFEIVIHGFMQAMRECHMLGELDLVPMSQMRSANKKHGNIGDIELCEGHVIVEAWDAKYGKPYLRDELEELRDKISVSRGVKIAGFIVDGAVDRRRDIVCRAREIEVETGVEILLLSFEEWIEFQTKRIAKSQMNQIAKCWMMATVESFSRRRLSIAPIDEPCEEGVRDLISKLKLTRE